MQLRSHWIACRFIGSKGLLAIGELRSVRLSPSLDPLSIPPPLYASISSDCNQTCACWVPPGCLLPSMPDERSRPVGSLLPQRSWQLRWLKPLVTKLHVSKGGRVARFTHEKPRKVLAVVEVRQHLPECIFYSSRL
jgi:hypothetical protein